MMARGDNVVAVIVLPFSSSSFALPPHPHPIIHPLPPPNHVPPFHGPFLHIHCSMLAHFVRHGPPLPQFRHKANWVVGRQLWAIGGIGVVCHWSMLLLPLLDRLHRIGQVVGHSRRANRNGHPLKGKYEKSGNGVQIIADLHHLGRRKCGSHWTPIGHWP